MLCHIYNPSLPYATIFTSTRLREADTYCFALVFAEAIPPAGFGEVVSTIALIIRNFTWAMLCL